MWDVLGAAGFIVACFALWAAAVRNSNEEDRNAEVRRWLVQENQRLHTRVDEITEAQSHLLRMLHSQQATIRLLKAGTVDAPSWKTTSGDRPEVRNVDTVDTLSDEGGPIEVH